MALSEQKKILISVFSGLIFLLLSKRDTYILTNSILSRWGVITAVSGCPTMVGVLIHTLVFILITWLSMREPDEDHSEEIIVI